MSATAEFSPAVEPRHGFAGRIWATGVAGWGVLTGIAPHVLHHVGPLAGAALLAGFGGKALFLALGLLLSIPLLRRLHRRFRTWIAPALAVTFFALVYGVSSLAIAPLVTGGAAKPAPPGVEQPAGHASHHTD